MILPSKFLPADRSLIVIGGDILAELGSGRTVSELWERVRSSRPESASPITFDWFALALTLLYAIGAVSLRAGLIMPGPDDQ